MFKHAGSLWPAAYYGIDLPAIQVSDVACHAIAATGCDSSTSVKDIKNSCAQSRGEKDMVLAKLLFSFALCKNKKRLYQK